VEWVPGVGLYDHLARDAVGADDLARRAHHELRHPREDQRRADREPEPVPEARDAVAEVFAREAAMARLLRDVNLDDAAQQGMDALSASHRLPLANVRCTVSLNRSVTAATLRLS